MNLSLCKGQAYDGANTMSGSISGLQARVKQVAPNALYVHCCAHNLNLVLIDSVHSCTKAVNFFGTLETLYSFISGSLPRLHLLQEEQERRMDGIILTLKKLSDTRWASHKRAVQVVLKSLPCIIDTLHKIANGEIPNTKCKTVSEANGLLSCMLTLEFMFLLQFWTKVLDSVNKLSEYLQNSSIDLITAENLIKSCHSGILEMMDDITFGNLERDAIELSNKCGGPEMFVEKRPQKKKKFFDELARDSVLEETRLIFKIDTFYTLLDTFSNQLEERFKDFTTVGHKCKVLDPTFFVQESFNECEEALSELADMYESDTEKEDLLSEFKSFCQLYKQMLKDAVISKVHKICDVLHFLEIREMSGIFSNLAKLYRIYNVLTVSSASAERSFSRLKQIKSYTRSTMDDIRLSDLSLLNIEKEFSENLDFNSVVDTFAKMKNRRKQLV